MRSAAWLDTRLATLGAAAWGLADSYLYVIGQYLSQDFVMTLLYFLVEMLINAINAQANLAEMICGVCGRGALTQSTTPARLRAIPMAAATASALTSALLSARRACTPSATCQG